MVVELWGKPCCIAVARDITEFEAAERKLRRNEAMLREIFDSSLDNISVVDLASNQVTDVNNELARRMGYSKEEMHRQTAGRTRFLRRPGAPETVR